MYDGTEGVNRDQVSVRQGSVGHRICSDSKEIKGFGELGGETAKQRERRRKRERRIERERDTEKQRETEKIRRIEGKMIRGVKDDRLFGETQRQRI